MSEIRMTISGRDYSLSGDNVHCATCATLQRELAEARRAVLTAARWMGDGPEDIRAIGGGEDAENFKRVYAAARAHCAAPGTEQEG